MIYDPTQACEALGRILSSPEPVIFLGAGASWDSGLPLGDSAAEKIVEACFRRGGCDDLWSRVAVDGAPPWPRFEVVLDILSTYLPAAPVGIVSTFRGLGLASTHRFLAESDISPLVLSTNFDDQMERALSSVGKEFRVVSSRSAMRNLDGGGRSVIVKLHGDDETFEPESDLGVRIDQILRAFPESASLAILEVAAGRPILIIGYAARDPDLSGLLAQLLENATEVGWIDLGPSSERVEELLRRNPASYYLPDGAPGALVRATGRQSPPALGSSVAWEEQIARWAASGGASEHLQAAATLCLERGDEPARKLVPEIHERLRDPSDQQIFWMLDREVETCLRAESIDEDDLKNLSDRLDQLSEDSGVKASVRAGAESTRARIVWRTGGGLERAEALFASAEERLSQEPGTRSIWMFCWRWASPESTEEETCSRRAFAHWNSLATWRVVASSR